MKIIIIIQGKKTEINLLFFLVFLRTKHTVEILTLCSSVLHPGAFFTPAKEKTSFTQLFKLQFLAALLPPTSLRHLSSTREERCELHQARFSQSEPLIITSQYQLQQPCTDAKTPQRLGYSTLLNLSRRRWDSAVPSPNSITSQDGTASCAGDQSQHKRISSHVTPLLSILHRHLLSFLCTQYCLLLLLFPASRSLPLSTGYSEVCACRAKDAIKIAEV